MAIYLQTFVPQIDDFDETNQISNDFDSVLKKFETCLRLKYGTLAHFRRFPSSVVVESMRHPILAIGFDSC